ncbi:Oidioi.mRNA.OKI2018_I69.chr2.g7974.t1.cds [Oikopleura dioica]|uniref:Oidioi.mRNA.OKI2018_I69.chr2.g7974.t1.cds n=1 Tax=Oikopleura dioica TaxID=34765 RepID=A0ABN7TDM3_OIKDI|nr:Oidioi.mRNA.OKI2018_I69.chr2.g7974.t1.cds [Oikopleura dioica]
MITKSFLESLTGKQIANIENLNLSNKNLSDADFEDGKDALSELVALDTLDVSGNRLKKFPDLTFSDCRVLNISHNCLEAFPLDAEMSWTLEEIDTRGNPALDINERFKIRELVPKLKLLDGETVPENDVFFTIKKTLTRDLTKLAAEKFKDELAEEIGQEKFLKRARRTPAGPKSLRDFRTWLAERIATDIINSDAPVKSAEEEVSTENDFYKNLKKKRGMLGVPTTNTPTGKWTPLSALQCHSQHPKKTDVALWAVEFEPDVIKNNETTHIFASCGGDALCFTNAKTGRVQSKFIEPEESLFCCSWSVDPQNPLLQMETMIAVGGKFGMVYIMKPHTGHCIHRIKAIRGLGVINSVKFAFPKHPELLFIAPALNDPSKNVISAWRVNTNSKSCQKLMELHGLESSSPVKMCLPNLNSGLSALFLSTDHGVRVWDIRGAEKAQKEKREVAAKFYHPNLPDTVIVDSIEQLDKNHMITKVADSGVIFIWTLEGVESEIEGATGEEYHLEPVKVLNWSNTDKVYLNCFACKGKIYAGDEDGQIWKYEPDLSHDSPEFQEPKEVIPWPIVKRTTTGTPPIIPLPDNSFLEQVPLEATIINDLATPASGRYLVAATNNNIVLTLKG